MAGKLLQIKMELTGLAAIPPSIRREVFRIAIGAAGEYWWNTFLPYHFQNVAYARYGYIKRTAGYERAKRRRQANGQGRKAVGEVKPLVWTGESRTRALSNRNVVAKAASSTRFYAHVILNAPALNYRNDKSAINMRVEVLVVTSAEEQLLNNAFQTRAIKEFVARGFNHKVVRLIRAA